MPVFCVNHDKSYKPDTAKSAIADYFNDLLGSLSDDPSVSLEDEKHPAPRQTQQDRLQTPVTTPDENLRLPEIKAQQEKTQTALESDRSREVLAPLVIPSTLPTCVPAPSSPVTLSTTTQTTSSEKKEQLQHASNSTSEVLENAPEIQSVPDEVMDANIPGEENENIQKPPAWSDNGRPPWGQNRFECLLFSVAGLKLAVPLISLGSIYRIEKELTPLVGRADWFMGLYQRGDRNVQVVDTAQWVMPDRYSDMTRERYQFIIRLGGNSWGMACDSVEQAVQLDPSQVIWRTVRSKRPWLSGTVIDHMCALLDVDTLSYMLQQQEKSII